MAHKKRGEKPYLNWTNIFAAKLCGQESENDCPQMATKDLVVMAQKKLKKRVVVGIHVRWGLGVMVIGGFVNIIIITIDIIEIFEKSMISDAVVIGCFL